MAMRFDDDVVVVTGAGRGLGREYALAFADAGAAVVVNDPGTEPDGRGGEISVAQAVVEEILARGGRAIADGNSVVTRAGAESCLAVAVETFGKVTVLVNNAGIISFAKLTEIDDDAWQRMIDVSLTGTFRMCRAAWPHMARQGHGRIINTTSNAGFAGSEQLVHYAAAKLGVAGLTKALAQEALGTGITVSAVAPMAITRMNREAFFGGHAVDETDWKSDIREGRAPIGPASVVAPAVLWLAHASSRINGQIFSVSSGKVARVGFVVEGWFDPDHSAEDLAEHEAQITELRSYQEPSSTAEELTYIARAFQVCRVDL
ncbi:SDR family NAD(P)-dependent oxidoreductase [Sphingomonas sp. ID0503]|uniref:SDR family NAD(P)-dependent oxidoreductase n=1 Tax=Sphingomonas sp. ID0503 TaxID=3399691 RepID=UPI003AFA30BA